MRFLTWLTFAVGVVTAPVAAAGEVSVVFYNIKFLNADALENQGQRKQRLRTVVNDRDMGGDAFGLSEIKDRRAVEAIFPPTEWGILIDDDATGQTQDNAIVFRKSKLELVGGPADLDADDANFLFPAESDNSAFPNRRDVLFAELRDKSSGKSFTMMVVHLKARVGGRKTTEWQRVAAARKIMGALETRYDGKPVVIGGDWNDNPDDRALNILETGDPNAEFGRPATGAGTLLVNLMEPLIDAGHVSHGKKAADIQANGLINTIDSQSRTRNANGHGTNTNTGDILFDQILVSDELHAFYKSNSVAVFNKGVALEGQGDESASDHLPVFAKFQFPDGTSPVTPAGGVRIVGLLPNPTGEDAGNEEVHLKNTGNANVDLQGWTLIDKGGSTFRLSGAIAPGATRIIKLPAGVLPLNNTGDTVGLFDPQGNEVKSVTYTKQQAAEGAVVAFN